MCHTLRDVFASAPRVGCQSREYSRPELLHARRLGLDLRDELGDGARDGNGPAVVWDPGELQEQFGDVLLRVVLALTEQRDQTIGNRHLCLPRVHRQRRQRAARFDEQLGHAANEQPDQRRESARIQDDHW